MKNFFRKNISLLLILFTAIYFLSIIFLNISLVGFWTDVVFLVLLVYFGFKKLSNLKKGALKSVLFAVNALYMSMIVIFLIFVVVNPLYPTSAVKVASFYFINVDGRFFNAYVFPATISTPGSDELSIHEVFAFCPLLEKRKFYERRFWEFQIIETDHNGSMDVKQSTLQWYIKNKVMKKGY